MVSTPMKFIISYFIVIGILITMVQPVHPLNNQKQIVKKHVIKPVARKKHIPIKIITSSKDQKCLALNIYWEARNQGLNGQIAVGYVTVNRVFSHKYPYTICEVVWEKRISKRTKKLVPQFSWTLDGKFDNPKEKLAWTNAKNIAEYVLKYYSKYSDPTFGALNYHADYVKPIWRNYLVKTKKIGTHIFYK